MPDRIVLCLDGTWNSTFNSLEREDRTAVLKPTNPLKVARAVLPIDPSGSVRQITYYDSGVGALGLYPGFSNQVLSFVDSKLGGAFGAGFEANVEQAATFLCQNYTAKTEVFVFGFSRGAAQAQALTNFLSWMNGIPIKSDAYYIPIFFRLYLQKFGEGTPMEFRSSSGDVPAKRIVPLEVTFLGVWDTVMALGSRFRASKRTTVKEKSFHVREEPAACVKHARQALAIDEKRYDFRPEIWKRGKSHQTLEQRWFPGAHANIGGSYGNDGLANSALHWIVEEAKALGLAIDEAFLAKYRPFPQDELGDPHTYLYKIAEALRFKLGSGKRSLDGHPTAGMLSLDPSVIKRLCSDPANFEDMPMPYRPDEVVRIAAENKGRKEEFIRSFGLDPATYAFPKDI